MYWASNTPVSGPQNSRIRIWTWPEDSTIASYTTLNVAPWTFTERGDAQCGDISGNWAARYDQRLKAGVRYSIHGTDVNIPGQVLAWWWNVAQGEGFDQPYIDAVAVYEDTLTQVEGSQGRPYIWDNTTCFAYPSATPNERQDLGMVFHYSTGTAKDPSVGFAIADDLVTAPPDWTIYNVRTSNARPSDNEWGDYNTVRLFKPDQKKVWAGASHYLPTTNGDCCSASEPVYFVFGRERDHPSFPP